MLINYLIKEITLFDNRADIIYNSPIKTTDSPDNSQGFSFYSKSVRLGHKLMIVTLFKIKVTANLFHSAIVVPKASPYWNLSCGVYIGK